MLAGGRFGDSDAGRTGIYGPGMSDEDIVAQAKRTLDTAFFVGLQHGLDESATRLMAKMGRRLSAGKSTLARAPSNSPRGSPRWLALRRAT